MDERKPEIETPPPAGLRSRVLRGGTFMVARQALGVVVSLVGVVLVTRAIGPAEYGKFAACVGVFMYFQSLAGWGIDVFLTRRPEGQVSGRMVNEAFTLLMAMSVAFGGIGLALTGPIERFVGIEGFGPMLAVFFVGLPVALAAVPARAQLERRLAYREIAVVELVTLLEFQALALGLAWSGYGAWSLVVAWAVQQATVLAMFWGAARYLPRPAWSGATFGAMLRFGLGYTASTSMVEMRTLINPLVVAPVAGAAAAGYVGMAGMFVFRLGVVKHLAQKMAVAALAKVQDRRERVRELLGEGMRLQVLCVGLPLAGFAWAGPWLIPALMGQEWAAVAELVPLVAVGYLFSAVFGLHASVLQVYDRNWDVAVFHAALMTVLFGASVALVRAVEPGYLGYGWAEVATVPVYVLIHGFLRREVGSPDYRVALVWSVGLSLAMLSPWLGPGAWAAAALALVWPTTWRHLGQVARQLKQAAIVRV
ncbi:MAG: oligosaccharide flippase family protein [Planctomycetota bacterium]